jgi:DNA repair protein RecO (recombination protein O)
VGLGRTPAIVVGRQALGESDRLVTFFSREVGKLRGVARAARRVRSRFTGAFELFTLGELVFFDTGRSDLVRIDHFDVVQPFAAVREDLERLGQAAWMAECVARLTGERDRQVGLYTLLVRGLAAMERTPAPAHVAVCFGARCLDLLGHRPRLDRCGGCGRRWPFPHPRLAEDGLACAACGRGTDATPVSPGAVTALARARALPWTEAARGPAGPAGAELRGILDIHMGRLIGQPTRAGKFLREVRRLPRLAEERA